MSKRPFAPSNLTIPLICLRVRGSAFKLTRLTKSVATLAMLSLLLSALPSGAQIPVTDVAANAQLAHILAMTSQVLVNTTQTATNTTTLQTISTQRQAISFALNSMQVLSDFGKMMDGNPLGDVKNSVAEFLKTREATAVPMDYVNRLPSFNDLKYDGSQLSGGNAGSIESIVGQNGMPVAADRNIPKMIFAVNDDMQHRLTEAKQSFQAGGASKAVRERNNRLASLRNSVDGASFAAMSFRDTGGFIFAANAASGQDNSFLKEMTDRVVMGASGRAKVSQNLVADGVFMRPAVPMDNYYIAAVQKGGATSQMTYYGVMDGLTGGAYDPLVGVVKAEQAPPSNFNLSNTLSQGGWHACQNYIESRAAQGEAVAPNPYNKFGYQVIPEILPSLNQYKPGHAMVVSAETVAAARARGTPTYNLKVPNVVASPQSKVSATAWETVIPVRNRRPARNAADVSDYRLVANVDPGPIAPIGRDQTGEPVYGGLAPTSTSSMPTTYAPGTSPEDYGIMVNPGEVPPEYANRNVVVVQPTTREIEQYSNQILSNDVRLSENCSMTAYSAKLMQYSDTILKALTQLRVALQALRSGSSAFGANEAVSQALRDADNSILHLQKQLEEYGSKVGHLLGERNDVLTARNGIVLGMQDKLARDAATRLAMITLSSPRATP